MGSGVCPRCAVVREPWFGFGSEHADRSCSVHLKALGSRRGTAAFLGHEVVDATGYFGSFRDGRPWVRGGGYAAFSSRTHLNIAWRRSAVAGLHQSPFRSSSSPAAGDGRIFRSSSYAMGLNLNAPRPWRPPRPRTPRRRLKEELMALRTCHFCSGTLDRYDDAALHRRRTHRHAGTRVSLRCGLARSVDPPPLRQQAQNFGRREPVVDKVKGPAV